MSDEIKVNPRTGRREMTVEQILERERLRYAETTEVFRARVLAQRAAMNGHGHAPKSLPN